MVLQYWRFSNRTFFIGKILNEFWFEVIEPLPDDTAVLLQWILDDEDIEEGQGMKSISVIQVVKNITMKGY